MLACLCRGSGSFGRRGFVAAGVSAAAVFAGMASGDAETLSASAGPADAGLLDDLVAANRILYDQGVVDGFGHVSVRHDKDPNRYLLSRSMAPALVTRDDIIEYDLDSNPVDARGRTSYLERFIHGELYKARSDIIAVVHSHSPAVIPFADTSVPLRPMNHIAGFLGSGVPVFEIRDTAGPATDMLIRSPGLGHALAASLGNSFCRADAWARFGSGGAVGSTCGVSRGLYRGECAHPGRGDEAWNADFSQHRGSGRCRQDQ